MKFYHGDREWSGLQLQLNLDPLEEHLELSEPTGAVRGGTSLPPAAPCEKLKEHSAGARTSSHSALPSAREMNTN